MGIYKTYKILPPPISEEERGTINITKRSTKIVSNDNNNASRRVSVSGGVADGGNNLGILYSSM